MPMIPKDMSNAAVARRVALSNDIKLVEAKRAALSEKVSATKRKRKSPAKSGDNSPGVHQA